jgi:hypothetical protein
VCSTPHRSSAKQAPSPQVVGRTPKIGQLPRTPLSWRLPRASNRLLVVTTDRIALNARRTMEQQAIPVGMRLRSDLVSSGLNWPASPRRLVARRAPRKKLRADQRHAVREVVAGFGTCERDHLLLLTHNKPSLSVDDVDVAGVRTVESKSRTGFFLSYSIHSLPRAPRPPPLAPATLARGVPPPASSPITSAAARRRFLLCANHRGARRGGEISYDGNMTRDKGEESEETEGSPDAPTPLTRTRTTSPTHSTTSTAPSASAPTGRGLHESGPARLRRLTDLEWDAGDRLHGNGERCVEHGGVYGWGGPVEGTVAVVGRRSPGVGGR